MHSEVAFNAQGDEDTRHRHLGHINERSMEMIKKIRGAKVSFEGKLPLCATSAANEGTQQVHSKTTESTVEAPLDLVCTDLMGPFTGGNRFVCTITDVHTR